MPHASRLGSELESLYDSPLPQMLLDDLVDVFLIDVAVPHALGIDHDHRPLLAAVETARGDDAHAARSGETELLHLVFGVSAQGRGTTAFAALSAGGAQIGAENLVMAVLLDESDCRCPAGRGHF